VAQKQDSIADAMGCSRQRLNRALGALCKAGYISLKRGAIEALDRGALDSWIAQALAGGTAKPIA
jgi:CRP/FNR family transcriptional regulator, cyclic AMP receptor protein